VCMGQPHHRDRHDTTHPTPASMLRLCSSFHLPHEGGKTRYRIGGERYLELLDNECHFFKNIITVAQGIVIKNRLRVLLLV
jgi:hypothetical protein